MRSRRLGAQTRTGRNPRRLVGVLLAGLMLQTFVGFPALADEWVDQQQQDVTGAYAVVPDFALAQTFTAGADGQLTHLALHMANPTQPVDLTVEIQSLTAASVPSGTVMAAARVSLPDPSPARWVDLPLSSPITLTTGTGYAILIRGTGVVSWSYASYAPYARGAAWQWTGDWAGASYDHTFRTYMNTINTPPVAVGESYELNQNTELSVVSPGLLANDTDAEGDALTAAVVQYPTHGTLSLQVDGSFHYMPDAGFAGSDSFAYTVNDGVYSSQPAVVALTVVPITAPEPTPDAPAPVEQQRWTGGGWIAEPASEKGKGHFALSFAFNQEGNQDGKLQYSFDGSDGLRYLVRVTGWDAAGGAYDAASGSLSVTGNVEIQQSTGKKEAAQAPLEGYRVRVDLVDGNPDAFSISIWDSTGALWHQAGGELQGGAIRRHGHE